MPSQVSHRTFIKETRHYLRAQLAASSHKQTREALCWKRQMRLKKDLEHSFPGITRRCPPIHVVAARVGFDLGICHCPDSIWLRTALLTVRDLSSQLPAVRKTVFDLSKYVNGFQRHVVSNKYIAPLPSPSVLMPMGANEYQYLADHLAPLLEMRDTYLEHYRNLMGQLSGLAHDLREFIRHPPKPAEAHAICTCCAPPEASLSSLMMQRTAPEKIGSTWHRRLYPPQAVTSIRDPLKIEPEEAAAAAAAVPPPSSTTIKNIKQERYVDPDQNLFADLDQLRPDPKALDNILHVLQEEFIKEEEEQEL